MQIIPATAIGSSVNRIATVNTTGLSFETAGFERARIDTSGKLLVGTDTMLGAMTRFFSDLTKSISQKRREQIERRKAEIRQRFSSETIHRLADNKLYKLTVDGWVEVQPRLDSDRA